MSAVPGVLASQHIITSHDCSTFLVDYILCSLQLGQIHELAIACQASLQQRQVPQRAPRFRPVHLIALLQHGPCKLRDFLLDTRRRESLAFALSSSTGGLDDLLILGLDLDRPLLTAFQSNVSIETRDGERGTSEYGRSRVREGEGDGSRRHGLSDALRRDLWLREFGTVGLGSERRVGADGDDGIMRTNVGSVEALEGDNLGRPRTDDK